MAGNRLRVDFVGGTITDNPLTVGATTFNSANLNGVVPPTGSQFYVVVFNPGQINGPAEICYLTAKASTAATSATILRGQETSQGGAAPTQFPQGTSWIIAPTAQDFTTVTNPAALGVAPLISSSGTVSDFAVADHVHKGGLIITTSAHTGLTPANGDAIYETDTGLVQVYNGTVFVPVTSTGAWTSYATTWGSSGVTQPSLGNGTLLARYQRLGKTLNLRIELVIGTTTTLGQGSWGFTLPAGLNAANNGSYYEGPATVNDGTGFMWGLAQVQTAVPGSVLAYFPHSTYNVHLDPADATHPLGWASPMVMSLQIAVELA